ncbi:MAG: MarR family transcriptional regulator [Blautia sp.]|nr:MarR family transcriptional regulator [Blautia sp.]MDY5031430.1 MarR family transcriptional regulator [Blautia sp.]
MKRRQVIGFEIHTLDKMIGRMIFSFSGQQNEQDACSRLQAWIVKYLYENMDREVFQKDIEARFKIARSTATGILQAMEKNGYIERRSHPSDARLKQLVLTQKGIDQEQALRQYMQDMEALFRKNIPQEQLDTFFDVIHQIKQNIESSRKE